MKRFLMYLLLLIILVAIGARIAVPFISTQPDTLGVTVAGSTESVSATLLQVISNLPRTEVITSEGDYIHATFTSQIMGYIDDVEFLIDADAGVVHVRSASRLGHSDLGVNRARVEEIRDLIQS